MYMENDRLFFTDVVLITQLRNEKANVGIVFTNSFHEESVQGPLYPGSIKNIFDL